MDTSYLITKVLLLAILIPLSWCLSSNFFYNLNLVMCCMDNSGSQYSLINLSYILPILIYFIVIKFKL